MKMFPTQRNWITAVFAASLAALLGGALATQAVLPPKHRHSISEVDLRNPAAPGLSSRAQTAAAFKQQVPGAEITFDRLLGTPKFVRSRDGFLTGPDGASRKGAGAANANAFAGDSDRAVKLFLNEHSDLFGFGAESLAAARKTRDALGGNNGMRTVVWEQQVNGVPVFESKLVASITKRGELVSISSRFVPGFAGAASHASLSASPAVAAQKAIASALSAMGEAAGQNVASAETSAESPFQKFTVGKRKANARLVYLPIDSGDVRLAWEIYVNSAVTREGFQILVDANTGETLVRKNLTCHISDATYNVYLGESPSPFAPGWPTPNAAQPPVVSRTLVTTNAFSTLASPNGWINDGDNETRGNNADAYLDRDFDFEPDSGRPQGNPERTFDFPLDLGQDPLSYSNAAVVQMFYKVNAYHDYLYELGFTEAFGNFQRDNFSRGGLGNDEILCYVQAGADVGWADNAFFIPAPDGVNGQIAMFVWDFPNPQRDGDLDSDVIYHEATHGTSWRLVGGGMGLGNLQGDGMGEGWSDFYALALSSSPTDDPDGTYPAAGYVSYQFFGLAENYYFGLRHFPYSTDMSKNPFTYKDIDPTQISPHPGVPRNPIYVFDPSEASEVHHQGEIWMSMLWEVRANLIRKYGGAVGNQLMLQLVTDGMKLTPALPSFIEARDAILLADQVNNGGANLNEIWRGFAKRGLGVGATSPDSDSTTGVGESFSIPGLQLISTSLAGGNGNGMIDPNECNDLFVTLTNASGAAATSVKLTLSSSTPGVFATVPVVNIAVFPAGAVISNIGPFRVSTIPEFVCGTTASFNLAVKSQQGENNNAFTYATGVLGTPMVFNSQVPVPIPDADPVGATSPIVVTNVNGAVGKVTVALYLTHTFDSDLLIELISPDNTTNVLAAAVGSSGDNFGTSCISDATRTVFDDEATIPISVGTAPFLGTYRPQFPLSIFNSKSGTNVNGTWQLHVVDRVGIDVGIIQCWSLKISPAECLDGGGSCPGTDLTLAMADFPDPIVVGSNLVYTLNVTNLGPNMAKGTVLSHNLPQGSVFVSATTTRGSVNHAGGVVTANLGNMPMGSVATVIVTVVPGQVGTMISSATVSSTEPEVNPANNVASVTTLVQNPSADLMVTLSGAPNPAVVGGALAYTATVINKGPLTASGTVVTNTMPGSVLVVSASSTQGSVNINGNTVIGVIGTLTNGGSAAVTINTVPLTAGTLFATSRVVGNLTDPVLANNTSTAAVVVGEAADLGISIDDQPDPVVVGSNFTYTVTVTNRGPNPATSVVVNQSLSADFTPSGNTVSQGSIVLGGNTAVWSVGTLASGASAKMTITGKSVVTGTLNTSASVNGAQTDPHLADNTAAASTLVATPFVSIVAAGASLQVESISPANGAIDIGETVTINLRLRNAGNVPNTNVVATLLATGGVTSPSGAQTYGVLSPGGLPVAKPYTFTATGTNGGTVTATLQITDGGSALSNVVFTFALPLQYNFTNTAPITIPSIGAASPYPSTITVSGLTGTVGQVTATLSNLNHTFAPDVDLLLVGPLGQKVLLMSGAGAAGVNNATVTFSDAATQAIPESTQITSGSYRPASYRAAANFPAPAPATPYSTNLSAFANLSPNGTWSLYIVDRADGDFGNVASGWRLGISLISQVNNMADLAVGGSVAPSPGLVGESSVWTITVTNTGPQSANGAVVTNTLSAGLVLQSATASRGVTSTNGGVVVTSLGTLETNGTATVTIVAKPVSAGVGSITATVAASDIDLNIANNSATISASNSLPLADVAVGLAGMPASAVVGSNLTLSISATNLGPGKALGTEVALPLPAGVSFQSAAVSKGAFAVVSNSVVCAFGDLVVNEAVSASIVVVPQTAGTLTNLALATTQSSDTNAINNQATFAIVAANPRPIITAAGAMAVSESQSPANGAIDPAETVTLALSLANSGQLPTVNLNASLQAAGGVGSPSAPQNYGVIAPGAATARNFTFTVPNTPGGTVTATLDLNDNGTPLGTVTFVFHISQSTTFANATSIIIPEMGTAAPYPSIITVSGITGVVGRVTVTLSGLSHSYPADVDALLVGPGGQKLMLMSDAGAGFNVTNLNLTFTDGAAGGLPAAALLTSGSFKATDFETGETMPAPAPSGVLSSQLTAFIGSDPNGNWSLYVADDSTGDGGSIGSGWSLTLTTIEPVSPIANLGIITATGSPSSVFSEEFVNYTIVITNRGAADATAVSVVNTLPAGATLDSATPAYTADANTVTFNLGTLAAGTSAELTVRARLSAVGTAVNAVSVSATQQDLDPSDNTATITTSVADVVPATLDAAYDSTNQVFEITLTGHPDLTYVLQRSSDLATWTPVSTNVAVGGTIKFSESASAAIAKRFYRAVRQTP